MFKRGVIVFEGFPKTWIKGSARKTANTVHCLWEEANKQGLWVLIKLLFLHKRDPHKYPSTGKHRTVLLADSHRDAVK